MPMFLPRKPRRSAPAPAPPVQTPGVVSTCNDKTSDGGMVTIAIRRRPIKYQGTATVDAKKQGARPPVAPPGLPRRAPARKARNQTRQPRTAAPWATLGFLPHAPHPDAHAAPSVLAVSLFSLTKPRVPARRAPAFDFRLYSIYIRPRPGIGAPSPARQLDSFRLYVRLSKLLGTGTTQMFKDLPSFEIRADWISIFVPSALNVG